MFKFTIFASEKANSKKKVYNAKNLSVMNEFFMVCEQGDKLGEGFVRGGVTGTRREDSNLEYSSLLIIDADKGMNGEPTPTIQECHEALNALGYSHILYTSHSHSDDWHKYRGIVELSEPIKQHELARNTRQLFKELHAQGCYIEMATETKTWSQIWFLPRSANPDSYIHLTNFEGGKFVTEHVTEQEANEDQAQAERVVGEQKTLAEMWDNIFSGKEYHESLKNLSYQMAKDGMDANFIKTCLTKAMENSKDAGSNRNLDRINEMDALVHGAFRRISKEVSDSAATINIDPSSGNKYYLPEIPPGRLGRMYHQIMECMPSKIPEAAYVMMLGLLAGISGAKFNVSGYGPQYTGLNLYLAFVAPTGTGKSFLNDFFNQVLHHGLNGRIKGLSGAIGAASFIGSNNHTGPKSLHDDLKDGRSKIFCMKEAGIMLGAKTGAMDELAAYIMDCWPESGYRSVASARRYSDKEKSLTHLKSPAITMVLESTQEPIEKALKEMKAIEKGYVPRFTFFKITDRLPFVISEKTGYEFDEDIEQQIELLIQESSTVQTTDAVVPNFIELDQELARDYERLCNEYLFMFEKEDLVMTALASRQALKVLRFAGIATIFNHWGVNQKKIPMDKECWEWGKKMAKWDIENAWHNLSYMTSTNEYDEIMKKIVLKIKSSCFKHKDASKKLVEQNVVTERLVVEKCKGIFADYANARKMNSVAFADKMFESMELVGLIKRLGKNPLDGRTGKYIKVLV